MKAMLIFAFFPLCVLLAQPLGDWFTPSLGRNAAWLSVLMISMGCAAHQAWSANIFSTVGDMFPKSAIATITGIGGMAGGLGSMFMQKSAGSLFTYSAGSALKDGNLVEMTKDLLAEGFTYVREPLTFFGFEGKPAGYFIIFCVCAVAYLIGWTVMKSLVPKYKPITDL
jgi:ACS family hexuronate transporter-like MFS transporter